MQEVTSSNLVGSTIRLTLFTSFARLAHGEPPKLKESNDSELVEEPFAIVAPRIIEFLPDFAKSPCREAGDECIQ